MNAKKIDLTPVFGAYPSSPLVPVLRSSSATKDGGEGRLRGKPSALCLRQAGAQGFERELRVEKLRLLSLRAERSNPTKSLRGHSPWQSQQFPLPCGERVGVREKLYALCAIRFALFRRGLTLRLHLRPVLGDYAIDALRVNPEQVEGLTSPYQFNTLLVVFRTLYRARGFKVFRL